MRLPAIALPFMVIVPAFGLPYGAQKIKDHYADVQAKADEEDFKKVSSIIPGGIKATQAWLQSSVGKNFVKDLGITPPLNSHSDEFIAKLMLDANKTPEAIVDEGRMPWVYFSKVSEDITALETEAGLLDYYQNSYSKKNDSMDLDGLTPENVRVNILKRCRENIPYLIEISKHFDRANLITERITDLEVAELQSRETKNKFLARQALNK